MSIATLKAIRTDVINLLKGRTAAEQRVSEEPVPLDVKALKIGPRIYVSTPTHRDTKRTETIYDRELTLSVMGAVAADTGAEITEALDGMVDAVSNLLVCTAAFRRQFKSVPEVQGSSGLEQDWPNIGTFEVSVRLKYDAVYEPAEPAFSADIIDTTTAAAGGHTTEQRIDLDP